MKIFPIGSTTVPTMVIVVNVSSKVTLHPIMDREEEINRIVLMTTNGTAKAEALPRTIGNVWRFVRQQPRYVAVLGIFL